jgi:hypothetical protein
LNVIAHQNYPALSEDLKDINAVDAILNGGDYSFIYRDYLLQAPNGQNEAVNIRNAIIGTPEERMEMYTYAFNKKWGMDPSQMSMNQDASAAMSVTNKEEFIHDLALYRSATYESSGYSNHFEPLEYVYERNDMVYRDTFDTYKEYLDAKEQELIEDSYVINDVSGYTGLSDFIEQVGYAANNGDTFAQEIWKEYISIQQSRVMCGQEDMKDNLYFGTPSDILPQFGIKSSDAMFQKYSEIGSDEAIVAKLLEIEHPGCNTFHEDGSIHLNDAGSLTGDALNKFNEDLAYYQDLLNKPNNMTALEYANALYGLDKDVNDNTLVTIPTEVTDVVPGDDPLTHVGIPATLLFAIGCLGWQKYQFRKAVNAEIEQDIVKAKASMELERRTQELINRWCGEGDNRPIELVKNEKGEIVDFTYNEQSDVDSEEQSVNVR